MAKKLPPHLRRAIRPVVAAKPVITVFSEGRNSEPAYLKAFARVHGSGVVSIRVHAGAGVPRTLVDHAVAAQRKARKANKGSSFGESDQFWVVFDCDEHPGIADAYEFSEAHGIGIAYSNPCFEIWLLLHCKSVVIDAPLHRHEAQRLLEEHVQSYSARSGKTIQFDEISDSYKAACERAETIRTRRVEEGDPMGNPYTDFDYLTEAIRLGRRKS